MLSLMRRMGIDYGTKRVGIALTDASGTMAFPHDTLVNDDTLLEQVAALAQEKEVGEVIIGESLTLAGVPNAVQQHIDAFAAALRETLAVPVHLVPEQFSTQAALREQGRTAHTDASAAALILDTYLTKQNRD